MSSTLPSQGTVITTARLPTGTVTFLFSDIEGSTGRWEANPPAMASALRRHDALMRGTIEASHGCVFKTVGDAFCAVFARPQEAMTAALAAQGGLAAQDFSAVGGLHVRMALHVGTADERDADYFGPAVNRVARLLAIGHGGQVLVSGTAADLLRGEMPSHAALRDLGRHRLKDLTDAEHVFELVAPGLPEHFEALQSLDALPNNLPPQLTSFVGRDGDIGEIKTLLQKHRLVTLVGTGGLGKTRCANQVGAELLGESGDGVWLVELAPLSDPSLVSSAIAQALSVREASNRPLLDTLCAYLKRKRILLIIDNCEHVIDNARSVIGTIVRSCPDVRVLATSREGLNVAGEHVYRMPSLSVPPAGQAVTTQTAGEYGAPALFADRALASSGRFVLGDDNAVYVAEICRRLDGIPLAIELAAARVKVLSPQQLLHKLDERFRVLTGGDRTALPRQQTMRALIDWSYDLLGDEERALFRKLSVFAGGFTFETATAVCVAGDARADDAPANGGTCAAEPLDEMAVLDGLSSLVDKSLVHAEPCGSGTRYRLLESTRQYAREKLRDCGEFAAVARAHASACVTLAGQLEVDAETTADRTWLAQVDAELENFRAALEWTLGTEGDVELGQRLAGALRPAWSQLAPGEGQRWVRAASAAAHIDTPATVRAKLELAEAQLDTTLLQHKACYAAAQRALRHCREVADPLGIAEAQRYAGRALLFLDRGNEGEVLLGEALAAARVLDARKLTGSVLHDLAVARQFAGDLAGARTYYAEALAIFKAGGAERLAGTIALHLAEAEFRGGDASAALRVAGDALATYRTSNATLNIAVVLCNMSAYFVALGRYADARRSAREALPLCHDVQSEALLVLTLQHLAAVAVLRPQDDGRANTDSQTARHARGAQLLGYVEARLTALEAQREFTEDHEYHNVLAALRDALGDDQVASCMNDGRTWPDDRARAEALLV